MSAQHLAGPLRGGQNNMRQQGFPAAQQQFNPPDQSFIEQLAFFSIHKPLNARSWDEATPVRHRLSSSEIRKALAQLQQNPRHSVKDTLMGLKSDSARRMIDALVQEQNEKLLESDPTSEWIIAGLDIQKETVKHLIGQAKIIKNISVILKTEPSPFNAQDFEDDPFGLPPQAIFEAGGGPGNHAHRNPHQHGNNMMQGGPPMGNQGRPMGNMPEPMPVRHDSVPPPPPPPPPHHMQAGPDHGGHMQEGGGPPQGGPPPHGQNPHMGPHPGQQPHGPQHGHHQGGPHGNAMPPPPGQGGPMGQPQVVQIPFDPHQQPRPMPGGFPEPMHGHGAMPPPPFDPHMLKHQKSKSSILRQEFHDPHEFHSDFDIDVSDNGSQFSSRSVEGGNYRLIERSASRASKGNFKRRDRSQDRSRERAQMHKGFKTKKSRGRSRSGVEVVHEDRHEFSSKHSSPRSSAAALPAQQPAIINIRIDNDNDRERERTSGRIREVYAPEHDSRRKNNPMSPNFSQMPYAKHGEFDAHLMSRHSSLGGSDTGSSVIDGNSSIYTSDDSVFSEPVRPRMHSRAPSEVGGGLHLRSRNIPIPRDDVFTPTYHESRRRQKPRFPADDYPPHNRRGSLYEDRIEPHRAPSYPRPPMASRRHSVQLSNPFDPRYPSQPSRSYTEAPSAYAYKSQPSPQRYVSDERPDSFELRAMADQLDAMDYINHSRHGRMPHRHNSGRGRMSGEVDEWAYRPQERYDGQRHF